MYIYFALFFLHYYTVFIFIYFFPAAAAASHKSDKIFHNPCLDISLSRRCSVVFIATRATVPL